MSKPAVGLAMAMPIAAALITLFLVGGDDGPGDDAGGTTLATTGAAATFAEPGWEVPGADLPAALDVLGEGIVNPPVVGTLETTDPRPIAQAAVGASGGTVAGSDGSSLVVPPGAHADPVDYTVTARDVTGHTFDPAIRVLSPLYTVDNGGASAAEAVTVEIPVALPEGAFAMGFVYDEAIGSLEGVPILDVTTERVTLATRSFSSFVVLGFDGHSIGTLPPGADVVDSGFRPGRDDWQFPNWGSVIAPRGHCAGQSLSAMWYFVEQRRGAGASPLYGLYDNDGAGATPSVWQDDSDGYRLASMAQRAYSTDPVAGAYEAAIDRLVLARFDAIQYTAFVTAIRVTGEPQLVGIMRTDPATGNVAGGHAMIVYRATATELDVADPNYPGRYRTIAYDPATTRFSPYLSGPDATDLGREYPYIGYYGKRRFVDWAALGALWDTFEAGTVGDGTFWPYELQVKAEDESGNPIWTPLTDGYRTEAGSIEVRALLPAGKDWLLSTLATDGTRVIAAAASAALEIPLAEGSNEVRIWLKGAEGDWPGWEYLDFVRLTVVRGPQPEGGVVATADPPEVNVPLGTQVTVDVTVANQGSAPLLDVSSYISGITCPEGETPRLDPGATFTWSCTFLNTSVGTYDREIMVRATDEAGNTALGIAGMIRTTGYEVGGDTAPCDPNDALCGLDTDA